MPNDDAELMAELAAWEAASDEDWERIEQTLTQIALEARSDSALEER